MIISILFTLRYLSKRKVFCSSTLKWRHYVTLLLYFLCLGVQLQAQQVDTWFSADRAVNTAPVNGLISFQPYPPSFNVPVTTWYDIVDFTPQDAVIQPINPGDYDLAPPNGFSYDSSDGGPHLIPSGTRPDPPVLRPNIFNFNPALEFDGSGDGQALHFRSSARKETAVFIVFQGIGEGNSAETQRLLFGGDIASHLNTSTATNLSLGISDGNVFSIGRTRNGVDINASMFQPGNIDLQGRPTIAVFNRDIINGFLETLTTRVNGINDIDWDRFEFFPIADTDLFYFNRLGKHFNSDNTTSERNFDGYIAEVLVLDTPAEVNLSDAIERMESYLAIKYGITLNGIGGLGSANGNTSYNYLAADGTIIWDFDLANPYNYDIAGIGRDRFLDFDGSPGTDNSYLDTKLRYNLHQRISKSANTEAIVTISTDTDFTSDNLNNSRTAIDADLSTNPREHNYLLWGNDHASLSSTNVELPIGTVTERISREWKVQKTSSVGVTPISGVSVRIELSGSDIPLTDPCTLNLMIDRDNPNTDGDFTTGTIIYIPASNIVGTDAFFDNVDFEDGDVFTIGFAPSPTIAINGFTDPTTCGGNDGQIVLDFTNVPDGAHTLDYFDGVANQAFNVNLVGGQTTINGLSAGTYNDITITVSSCTSTDDIDITLTDPAIPTIAINGFTDPTTCGGNDGQIVLDFTNVPDGAHTLDYFDGVANQAFNVNLVGGQTTINGLSAGTYNDITITVSSCTSTDDIDITLTDPAIPTIAINGFTDPTTCGGNDGQIVLDFTNVPDGAHTLDYFDGVANQAFNVNLVGGQTTINGLSAGTYNDITITVSSCTSTDDIDITLTDPAIPTIAINGFTDPTTCGGNDGQIVLDFTNVPDGAHTLDYFDGVANQAFNVNLVGGQTTINGLSAGTYNDITITVSSCTSTDDIDITLTDPAIPTIAINGFTDPTTCGGNDGQIVLDFTNVPDGAHTLDYFDGVANQAFNVNLVGGQTTINGLSAGTYNDITITVSSCTSTDDIDITLTDPAIPTIAINGFTDPTTCGGNDGQIVLDFTNVPDGAHTLDYFDGAANQTFNVNVVGGQTTINGLSAGTYNDITITVSSCTSTDDIDITLTDPAIPTIAINGFTDPTTCGGNDGQIVLDFTNVPDGAHTLDYFDGAANQTFNVNVVGGQTTINGLSAGTYNDITITVSSCTSTDDIDITLTDPAIPTIAINGFTDPTTCGGNDGQIVLDFTNVPDGAHTLDYFDGAANQTFNVNVVGGQTTINGLSAGTYNDITITVSSCTSTDDIDITLTDPAIPTIAINGFTDPTTCGGNDGQIVLDFTNVPDGAHTLDYFDGAANQTFNVNVVGGQTTINGLSAGTYNDITITVSSCTSTDDIDITLTDPAIPTIAINGFTDPTTCGGNDGQIVLDFTNVPDGAHTLDYFDGAANQTFNVNVVGGQTTINGLSAGTYNDITITVSSCTSTDDIDITLTDPAIPTIAINGFTDPTTCGGNDGQIVLDFTNVPDGAHTLDYFDGAANQTFNVNVVGGQTTINGLSAGTYNDITITVSSCTSTDDIDITLTDPAIPTIAINGFTDPTTCGGNDGQIVLDFTNVPDGAHTLDYFDGAANQTFNVNVVGGQTTINGLSAGTYNDINHNGFQLYIHR